MTVGLRPELCGASPIGVAIDWGRAPTLLDYAGAEGVAQIGERLNQEIPACGIRVQCTAACPKGQVGRKERNFRIARRAEERHNTAIETI